MASPYVSIGARTDGNNTLLDTSIAQLWFGYGNDRYLDFSEAENVNKFRTVVGKPANLGTDGSAPLGGGVAPQIYFQGWACHG